MKNKLRTILCVLIATVFLMPLMGNTVVGSSTAEYHFNSYNVEIAWEKTPDLMVDGDKLYFAGTENDFQVELCNGNTCDGTDLGVITKVEIRANASYSINQATLILLPVFGGSDYGYEHSFEPQQYPNPRYSNWFDITNDKNAPKEWSWSDVSNLDCKVNASEDPGGGPFELHCSIVEIRVTYNPS